MRAKLIYCLLLAIALNTLGCAASPKRSSEQLSRESPRMRNLALSNEAPAEKLELSFNEGVALAADLRYSQATAKLLPLIEAFEAAGDQNRAAEATFWVGYCYEKQGQKDKAVDFYSRVAHEYPQTSACRQATERLSRLTTRTVP